MRRPHLPQRAAGMGTVKALALAAGFVVAGCECVPQKPVEVQVPVPVACEEPIPEAPAWVTETSQPRDLVEKVGTLAGEIEQRRGFEARLIATIKACRREP